MIKILKNERGVLSYMVALVFVTLLTVVTAGMFLMQRNTSISAKRSELRSKAIHIAEGGMNNYLWHMNSDENYYLTHQGSIPWSTYEDGEYSLNVEPNADSPGAYITATGKIKVPGTKSYITKTIKASIQKRSFTNYLYFSDHETVEGTGQNIWFITGDVIHGPLHSNDYLRISGDPVFEAPVRTARTLILQSGSNPDFQQGYEENVEPLELPPSNTELKTWAQNGGYYYYGKTEITMNSNATLSITNSNSQSTGPTGSFVSLPSNGVIYVDGQLGTKYNSTTANIFLSGTLSGELTVASKNDIYIVDDIYYNDPNSDVLGIIADNYVYVNHYDQSWHDVAPVNLTVDAAIFALNHSFTYEYYSYGGSKGTLHVSGAIIQKYRGPIGTFFGSQIMSGYSKDYRYDNRMLYSQPPHFLEPLNSGYEIVKWEEVTQ